MTHSLHDQLPSPGEDQYDLIVEAYQKALAEPDNLEVTQWGGFLRGGVDIFRRALQTFQAVRENAQGLLNADVPALDREMATVDGEIADLEEGLRTIQAKLDAVTERRERLERKFHHLKCQQSAVVLKAFSVRPTPGENEKNRKSAVIKQVFADILGAELLEKVRNTQSKHFPTFGNV